MTQHGSRQRRTLMLCAQPQQRRKMELLQPAPLPKPHAMKLVLLGLLAMAGLNCLLLAGLNWRAAPSSRTAAGACTAPPAAPHEAQQLRVPRLLHRNYMAGAAALEAATLDPASGFKAHWLASCSAHNPGWREVVWDEAAVRRLMARDFPWFAPTFDSYTKLVQRSDVSRYMVLWSHGGVYLDADVECYSSIERSLLGKDLVLNCEHFRQFFGQMHNAVMASAPHHPFWLAVLREAAARAPAAAAAAAAAPGLAGLAGRVRLALGRVWRAGPFHNKVNAVLRSTGPQMITAAYRAYSGCSRPCGNRAGTNVSLEGRLSHVYPLGSWFTPCFFSDEACQRTWLTQHALLARSPAAAPRGGPVIGIHHYSGSWTGWDHSDKHAAQAQLNREASGHVAALLRDSASFLEYACTTPLAPPQAGGSSSSNGGGGSGGGGGGVAAAVMPLCMELLQEALANRTCAVLSVLAPAAGPASSGRVAAPPTDADVATEVLLQQAGCHVVTVSPDSQPPAALQLLGGGGSNSSGAGLSQHVQGVLQPEPSQQPAALSLQELLRLDPRQQPLAQLAGSQGGEALPLTYVLRLSCSGCELPALQRLFSAPRNQSSVLQRAALLVLDVQPQQLAGAAASGQDQQGRGGLDELFNVLYQLHGFAGFMRQRLPGGALRLGWVRQPGRLALRPGPAGD